MRGALPMIALRFGLAYGAVLAIGYVVFRELLFETDAPQFQCVTAGALAAALLALMRSDRPRQAGALAVAIGFLRLGFAYSLGWPMALAGVLQVGGLYLVALIFDLLGRRGILFGKFLVLGPLLAGVFLATTPLAFSLRISGPEILPTMMHYVFLGLLIGDTAGLGIEVADLFIMARMVRQDRPAEGG